MKNWAKQCLTCTMIESILRGSSYLEVHYNEVSTKNTIESRNKENVFWLILWGRTSLNKNSWAEPVVEQR